jgi:hypothetical protein
MSINTEDKPFNFYLQPPNTVQVGAIHMIYMTVPSKIIPGTPCMETE